MLRHYWLTLLFLLPLATLSAASGSEPVDRAALRNELAELKAAAKALAERIDELEQRLVEPLRIHDLVTVEFEKEPFALLGDYQRRLADEKVKAVEKVMATVDEVLPNGDYVLRSHRTCRVDEKIHQHSFSGVVARSSIDSKRHVSSDAIRDLEIQKTVTRTE